MKNHSICSRRSLIKMGLSLAAGGAFLSSCNRQEASAPVLESVLKVPAFDLSQAKVAISRCKSYGTELLDIFKSNFDLLGGIGSRVKNKTVTIKVNLTGSRQRRMFDRTAGEVYVTHDATVKALCSLFLQEGATRVRLVESAPSSSTLEEFAAQEMDWDAKGILDIGKVEFENTRNLGLGKDYCKFATPSGGYIYEKFMFNHSYQDTDFLVSLAKLKNHATAGVTLSMKNMFGITPNSVYGDDAGSEESTKGRGFRMHGSNLANSSRPSYGEKSEQADKSSHHRIPMIVADVCGARPVDLAIIDGITSISGGEGPWCWGIGFTTPGVIISGLNPVSTDAVATAVMGYANPRAEHFTEPPFDFCMNHILLAEQAGVGTADLARIDVSGLTIDEAKYPYPVRDSNAERPQRRRRGGGRSQKSES